MANRNDNADLGQGSENGGSRDGRSGDQRQQNENEWLRDQVGEDHNLSGSSTYRTLPEQPESDEDAGARDANERQSNR